MSKADITKRAIVYNFKKLVEENHFNKITVTNLCTTTGISRRCFYCYFKDVYDVINWIFYDEFLSKYTMDTSMYFFDSFFYELCDYFHNNASYYSKIISLKGQNSIRDYLISSFTPLVIDDIKRGISNDSHARIFLTSLIDIGILSITQWLESEEMLPTEQFVQKCLKISSDAAYNFADYVTKQRGYASLSTENPNG